jgi:hypothetical protein
MLPRHLAIIALAVITPTIVTTSIASGPNVQGKQSSASSDASERTIVGVWRTVVTPVNCQTGAPLGPLVIRGLSAFHEGGTMSEFGVAPGSSPALRSPGHGVWQREHGWQDYSFAFTHSRYDASGAFIGSQTVRASLELDASGDEFTTKSAIEVLDTNNNVIATGCATSVGTRFE